MSALPSSQNKQNKLVSSEQLLTVRDVAVLLATGTGAAKGWLMRHGVPLINLGVGRGLGYRWRQEDVFRELAEATTKNSALPTKTRQCQRPFHGKTMRDRLAMLRD